MPGFEPRISGVRSDRICLDSAAWLMFGRIEFIQTGGQPYSDTTLVSESGCQRCFPSMGTLNGTEASQSVAEP